MMPRHQFRGLLVGLRIIKGERILFHRTTAANAAAILAEGFRDGTGYYLTNRPWTGVWLSDEPLDSNEGAEGDTLLRVVLDAAVRLERYEWAESGRSFREFLVPAALINAHAEVTIIDEDALWDKGVRGHIARLSCQW
jgi:hypothetical protein